MDPFMQGGPINGHVNGATRPDEDLDILPRSVLQARQKFRLEKTGSDALVRRLPLARLVTMSGLSPSMYPVVMEIFEQITGGDAESLITANRLDLLRKNDALIDGIVMLGFIKPRIVATQEEAAAANDPYVWCIDEVDPDDRQAYFDLVTAGEAEAAKVLEPFPTDRLQDSDADESSPVTEPAERPDGAAPGDEPRPVELSVV